MNLNEFDWLTRVPCRASSPVVIGCLGPISCVRGGQVDSQAGSLQDYHMGWGEGPRGQRSGRNYWEGDLSFQTSSGITSSWKVQGAPGQVRAFSGPQPLCCPIESCDFIVVSWPGLSPPSVWDQAWLIQFPSFELRAGTQ